MKTYGTMLQTVFEVETETETLAYDIEAHLSKRIPACSKGHPDNWTPEEGGEVEEVCITLDGEEVTGDAFIALHGQEMFDRLCASLEAEASNCEPEAPWHDYDSSDAVLFWN